jgi:hypothetical protein
MSTKCRKIPPEHFFVIDPIATLRYNKVNVLQLKVCLRVFNSHYYGRYFECH